MVGTETKNRKHVDWEIYSSMYDGQVNKRSGVLVILLPSAASTYYTAAHGDEEKSALYSDNTSWVSITSRAEFERRFPYAPPRIIDNLLKPDVKVSVANWATITATPEKLKLMIDFAFRDKDAFNYDLSRPMRRTSS